MLFGLLRRIVRRIMRAAAPDRRPRPAPGDARRLPEPRGRDDGPSLVEPPRTRPVAVACPPVLPAEIVGEASVVDGDTIIVAGLPIRLFRIDAPELDHPWGWIARAELILLCDERPLRCVPDGTTTHDRLVVRCCLPDGRDLSAEMVRRGLAIDWPKFSRGAYRALEPPGVRMRLWRCAARQRGAWPPPPEQG